MQVYVEGFADVYNTHWVDFVKRTTPILFSFYEQTEISQQHKSLLDIGCGTGQLAVYFLERGFQVIGIDSSSQMLARAYENARQYIETGQARFIEGDAAAYTLDMPVGLAVSTYNALNHLPDMAALQGAFRSTAAALVEGGWFLFDLNTRLGLLQWSKSSVQNSEDLVLINRGVMIEDLRRAYTHITGFKRQEDGLYARFDQVAYNTVFDLGEVTAALHEVGFRRVYCAHSGDLKTPLESPESLPMVFIVAQK